MVGSESHKIVVHVCTKECLYAYLMLITKISLRVTDLNTSPFQLYTTVVRVFIIRRYIDASSLFMLMSNEGSGEPFAQTRNSYRSLHA